MNRLFLPLELDTSFWTDQSVFFSHICGGTNDVEDNAEESNGALGGLLTRRLVHIYVHRAVLIGKRLNDVIKTLRMAGVAEKGAINLDPFCRN